MAWATLTHSAVLPLFLVFAHRFIVKPQRSALNLSIIRFSSVLLIHSSGPIHVSSYLVKERSSGPNQPGLYLLLGVQVTTCDVCSTALGNM
ncbi:uncharacterized protein BJ212DRAFT_778143 [Suillus subaureus]|uniref:Secreted protein n=1 Tax=Suillus subaureus TaxID=48587 RepID=A0A9P7DZW4_9AGAM|nr:uncharacterized protein BJ212DRAFT_778143 [Suillus subaureus]KAG1807014.1 hypothetical protein BJ212DRAFT_778143 [Suillus subaureus]